MQTMQRRAAQQASKANTPKAYVGIKRHREMKKQVNLVLSG